MSTEKSFERVQEKLRKLIRKTPSFDEFIRQIRSFPKFYLGHPIPEEMRTWNMETYKQFYLDNGGQREP